MGKRLSKQTKEDLIGALRHRYSKSSKKGKTRILDEFVAVSEYHRKHAIRILRSNDKAQANDVITEVIHARRIYDEAVKEALIVTWEAADRICGKRLKAILPDLVGAMERHGHLNLDAEIRERLLSASAATIDRLLAPFRNGGKRRKKRRKRSKAGNQIPVRTFADWEDPTPGYFEIDFVAHCGGAMAGSFIHTFVLTDVCSGWIECVPLLAREQSLVVAGIKAVSIQIPFSILGIDSDNDGAFINDTVLSFCKNHHIEFTRSRAYHKNDQAWVEQKNGAVVRRMVGHDRFSGVVAGQTLAHLYQAMRLYVNYFQPSFKLRKKTRHGAKVKRIYYAPATPCERLLEHPAVSNDIKDKLRSHRERLDPVDLLHRIRESQAALTTLTSSGNTPECSGRKTLDQFLLELPRLWQSGEVRPTHRAESAKSRHWRTRKDAFEDVWSNVLLWLQLAPDTTAKELFCKLQREYPGRYADGQLRTLQRRIQKWRQIMARELVYACANKEDESSQDIGITDNGSNLQD